MLMDDRDPPWIRKNIKGLIHDKKLVYKKHLKKNNSETQRTLYEIQDQILLAIENSNTKYYQKLSNKLNDAFKHKRYWSILKIFSCSKKVPCIPRFNKR